MTDFHVLGSLVGLFDKWYFDAIWETEVLHNSPRFCVFFNLAVNVHVKRFGGQKVFVWVVPILFWKVLLVYTDDKELFENVCGVMDYELFSCRLVEGKWYLGRVKSLRRLSLIQDAYCIVITTYFVIVGSSFSQGF